MKIRSVIFALVATVAAVAPAGSSAWSIPPDESGCFVGGFTCEDNSTAHGGTITLDLVAGSLGAGADRVMNYARSKGTISLKTPAIAVIFSEKFKSITGSATYDTPMPLFDSGFAAARAFFTPYETTDMCACDFLPPGQKTIVSLGTHAPSSLTMSYTRGDRSHFVRTGPYSMYAGVIGLAQLGETQCVEQSPEPFCFQTADTGTAHLHLQATLDRMVVRVYRLGLAVLYDSPSGQDEYVVLQNPAPFALSLKGWAIKDGQGHTYRFGSVSLASGKTIRLYTSRGRNTADALHWGLSSGVWDNGGDTLTIADPSGVAVRCSFTGREQYGAKIC
ncbi:MAG: lamin tail domain-containing protein [Actinomycetota bacterium]|nr:lamin tail domain-containing protein [Actinomycetota bacterium]